MDMIATIFATEKHFGQVRKFDGSDYVNHPLRVSRIVASVKNSHRIADIVSASKLHDTLEDTNTTVDELTSNFGSLVSSLVVELTSDKEEIKKLGKKEYLANKMITISSWALVIKLADRLDNVSDFSIAPAKFVEKYSIETSYILNKLVNNRVLTKPQKILVSMIKEKIR